ncbi:MAG: hypothetical protein U0835_16720 [Isosphaeraceae bacterium]
MDGRAEDLSGPRRPRDLALLWLAVGTGPPRARARDQQADLAGGDLLRRLLDEVAARDPESDELEETLASTVVDLGGPSGPARALAAAFLLDWRDAEVSPGYWDWLLNEAVYRSSRDRDRRQEPDRAPE